MEFPEGQIGPSLFFFLKVLVCGSGTDRDVVGADLAWSWRGGACQSAIRRGERC